MNDEHLANETLIDYLHHELSPRDDAWVMQHLSSCDACRAELAHQTELTESLRVYAQATERELPVGVIASIWDAVDREARQPNLAERLHVLWKPAFALPAAAALIAGLYFGVIGPYGTTKLATIDAAYYLEDHAALTNTVPFNEGTVVPASLENDETGSDQHWVASTGASDIAADR